MQKIWVCAFVFLLAGCQLFEKEKIAVNAPEALAAKAMMHNRANEIIGEIHFTETANGVELTAVMNNLPPGVHGIHLHEAGVCEPPSFESAGAHFNPIQKQHGIENVHGPHAGDLPNITADEQGSVQVNFVSADFTLKKGALTSIFDDNGTAIVIHEHADDYKTDPSGNSGARIACGVIQ